MDGPNLLTGESFLASTTWQDQFHGSLAWPSGSPPSAMCAATGTRFEPSPIQSFSLCSENAAFTYGAQCLVTMPVLMYCFFACKAQLTCHVLTGTCTICSKAASAMCTAQLVLQRPIPNRRCNCKDTGFSMVYPNVACVRTAESMRCSAHDFRSVCVCVCADVAFCAYHRLLGVHPVCHCALCRHVGCICSR